jgi:hypothetical protein
MTRRERRKLARREWQQITSSRLVVRRCPKPPLFCPGNQTNALGHKRRRLVIELSTRSAEAVEMQLERVVSQRHEKRVESEGERNRE